MKKIINFLLVAFIINLNLQNSYGQTSSAKIKRGKAKVQKNKFSRSMKKISKRKGVKFIKAKVLVYEGETLADILRRFVRDDAVIFRQERMVDMTIKRNPQIEDWRNLKTGQALYIYLDPKFIDTKKITKFRKRVKKVAKKIRKKVKKRKKSNVVKKYSIFYMASIGQFSQKNDDLAEIDFKQNSPITLGTMYTHFPKKGNYTVSMSAYFSYLLAASTNTEDSNVDLPLEIGLNAYYQHPVLNGTSYIYGGADFEKFNTFNLKGVESDNEISFDENQMFFLTAGFSKTFSMLNRKFLFKGSLSQSLLSSRTVGFSGDDSTDALHWPSRDQVCN